MYWDILSLRSIGTKPTYKWSDPNVDTVEYFQKHPGLFHGKLIIDTDCGADDAMAILFALAHRDDFDILAITTVNGNTIVKNVIVNVLKTLRVVKSDVSSR